MTSVRLRVLVVTVVVVAAVAGALMFEALLSLGETTPFGHDKALIPIEGEQDHGQAADGRDDNRCRVVKLHEVLGPLM